MNLNIYFSEQYLTKCISYCILCYFYIPGLRSSEEIKRLKEEFNQGPSPGAWYYSKYMS